MNTNSGLLTSTNLVNISMKMKNPLYSRYSSVQFKELISHVAKQSGQDPETEKSILLADIFSLRERYLGWRNIWWELARIQSSLGLNIPQQHLAAIQDAIPDLDISRVQELEKETKHDVMAALHEFREKVENRCSGAGAHLHAGGTSCLVTDNQELITLRRGLELIRIQLTELGTSMPVDVMGNGPVSDLFKELNQDLTIGLGSMKARGAKGTTGTQASYLDLFDGDHVKVRSLDTQLSKALGFNASYAITSQTYPRLADYQVLSLLARIGVGLEQIFGAIIEVRSKSLKLTRLAQSACEMAANQWIERTLDDSSSRRVLFHEAFLTCSELITLCSEHITEISMDLMSYAFKQEKKDFAGALKFLKNLVANVLNSLHIQSLKNKNLACLGWTHFQVAQPTTYGKRFSLWAYPFILSFELLDRWIEASLVHNGSNPRLQTLRLDALLNQWMLAAHKIALDIRLLMHDEELSEPFSHKQVGSSAMAYKKNPMKSERINGLARLKWGVYSFDESPGEALLCCESVLRLLHTIFHVPETDGSGEFSLQVRKIRSRLADRLPFLASERILMESLERGCDRLEIHEVMRKAMLLSRESIDQGGENPFLEILAQSGLEVERFVSMKEEDWLELCGRSSQQVDEFSEEVFQPFLKKYMDSSSFEAVEI